MFTSTYNIYHGKKILSYEAQRNNGHLLDPEWRLNT